MIEFNSPFTSSKNIEDVNIFLKQKKKVFNYGLITKQITLLIKKNYKLKNIFLTNSCTSALEMSALLIASKKKGEIIMAAYNYPTTASAFIRAGHKIKFIDIESNNMMPSYERILAAVNKKTVGIVITHYAGKFMDKLEKLKKECIRKKIFLVEDAAQALGTFYNKKSLGSFGDFACFSFHETKNIHSGSGGMLIVNNKKYKQLAKYIYDRGTDRSEVISGIKNKYQWVCLGSSFNMTELNASFLLNQIKIYKKIILYRKKLFDYYIYYLKKHQLQKKIFYFETFPANYNYHSFFIILKNYNRIKILNFLKKNKIQAYIGYVPLHTSKFFKSFAKKIPKLNNTNILSQKIIRLPVHNFLEKKNIQFICKSLNSFFLQ